MRAYILAFALLFVIFGSIGIYQTFRYAALSQAGYTPPPITVAADFAEVTKWNHYLQSVGTINAVRGVDLTAEESGVVIKLNFDSGDKVEQGQLLVVLNDRVEQASRRSQEATLDLAKLSFKRAEKLLSEDSTSKSEYDHARADLERARGNLAETEARLANKKIRAPFSGTTGIRRIDVGDYISPGTIICTLQDLGELEIDFTLPSQAVPALRVGLPIELRVDAFEDQIFPAVLVAVDSKIDPNTRNVQVRAQMMDSSGLLPGMFAQVLLGLDQEEDALIVPETAVTYSLHGNIIYLVREGTDGKLTAVPSIVETGETRNGRVRVLSGISAGDRVVTAGQNKLYRGAQVVIDENVTL